MQSILVTNKGRGNDDNRFDSVSNDEISLMSSSVQMMLFRHLCSLGTRKLIIN